MKLYTELDLVELVQSLKDYTHESHSILGYDEREAREFVDIFLKDRKPIELPTDEDIETEASGFSKKYRATTYEKSAYVIGAKWVIEQINNKVNENNNH